MKLLNQSLKQISISVLIIIGLWGTIFFFNMVDEIKKNVDEGLANYKRQIIYKAHRDTSLLSRIGFEDAFYAIHEIDRAQALAFRDQYIDTAIYVQDANDPTPRLDPVRMLTTAFKDDGKYYQLKIINPMVEKDDLVQRLLWNMVWLYAVLIITIILINNLVLKNLWKPFYRLLHKIQHFQIGSGYQLPEVKTETKEFKDLQKAIDTLLQRNIRVYEQQKQFIGNASHELQTPLSITINKLELLLEKGNLDQEQAERISDTMHIIERLIRLNKSLLLLTKIENKQFLDQQPVSVLSIVEESMEDLKELAAFKQVQFTLKNKTDIQKEMDPALAEIFIQNLLRNALFHNLPDGEIQIALSKNRLTICNTSPSPALDRSHIFKRFYKVNPQQSNTGLGLAIIKAIADNYQITISYSYRSQMHCFELLF